MINKKLFYGFGMTAACLAVTTGCVSTETVDNPNYEKSVDEIVLTVSAPESFKTRADDKHKLRYVAKLFKAQDAQIGDYITRKDLIDGNDDNTLKFKVEPGNYRVMVFADYIPSTSQCDEDGIYPDYYYDTSAESEFIEMKNFSELKASPLNNDNYDCFYYYSDSNIHKVENEAKTINPVLKRAVAKIRFVANGEPDLSNFNLSISKFHCFNTFAQAAGMGSNNEKADFTYIKNQTLSSPTSGADNELFYFYTFASGSKNYPLNEIEFTVTNNAEPITTSIASGVIPAQRNYITTVKGNFAYVEPEEDDQELKDEDCIILNDMSVNQNWSSPDNSYDQK